MNIIPDFNFKVGNVTISCVNGELSTIIKIKDWYYTFKGENFSFFNLGGDGKRRFSHVINGIYGEPWTIKDPDLAMTLPARPLWQYKNEKGEMVQPDEKLASIICEDEAHRFSLSNAKRLGHNVRFMEDGSLMIDEETWWIHWVLRIDKNMVTNYVGYAYKDKPANRVIVIREIADLVNYRP
mgnify:CR=1 FL=1